mmetsp:Transcript_53255/g.173164  ORF Transcript_53255/g.173164 Transcript_53255/m.173164 type:complete len:120 (+) Transcript_53255:119-478(+)
MMYTRTFFLVANVVMAAAAAGQSVGSAVSSSPSVVDSSPLADEGMPTKMSDTASPQGTDFGKAPCIFVQQSGTGLWMTCTALCRQWGFRVGSCDVDLAEPKCCCNSWGERSCFRHGLCN